VRERAPLFASVKRRIGKRLGKFPPRFSAKYRTRNLEHRKDPWKCNNGQCGQRRRGSDLRHFSRLFTRKPTRSYPTARMTNLPDPKKPEITSIVNPSHCEIVALLLGSMQKLKLRKASSRFEEQLISLSLSLSLSFFARSKMATY